MNKHSGFSLIEMAVVLVIAGLILGAVMSMGNAQITQSRISTTKSKEDAVKTALISYIARNKRMPCPAVPTLAAGTPGYGVEATTFGTCDGVPTAGAGAARVVVGIIPWVSLGMSDEAASDGYYNRFTYAVTSNATNLNVNSVAGMKGNITVHTATPPTASNQSNDCTPTGGFYNPCSIVAVILSHGANANGAYTSGGTKIADPTGVDELENVNIDNAFVEKDFSANLANPFDDILLALNASDLLSPLTLNSSLKDSNAAIEHNFDVIAGAVATSATANRIGLLPGSRTYPLPAALTLPAISTTDPWGNGIIYTRVTAIPIAATTPDGPAYTITSYGPDGVSGGADDIIRNISISDLQATFSTYGW